MRATFFIILIFTIAPSSFAQNFHTLKLGKDSGTLVVYSDQQQETKCSAVDHLIVSIHGTGRTASGAYSSVYDAAKKLGLEDQALIVSPLFANLTQLENLGYKSAKTLYWDLENWKWGGNSKRSKLSSFTAVEKLIDIYKQKCPALKKLTLIGHSAGGQFTQRFAALGKVKKSLFPDGIKFIVANPSSYLYFNSQRPILSSNGLDFANPDQAATKKCPSYNKYRFGLEGISNEISADINSNPKKSYASRRVSILIGELDNDPNDSSLDISCGAQLQGTHRKERGENFYAYIQSIFSPKSLKTHKFLLVPAVAHSSSGMYGSKLGSSEIFSD